MLEWMIAIAALCGAIAGIASLFIVLHLAWRVRTVIGRDFPRARIHRDSLRRRTRIARSIARS